MAKSRKQPFQVNIQFDAGDLEPLFEPFDPLTITAGDPRYPDLPETDEPFDPIDWDYLFSIRDTFLNDLIDRYFRAEMYGVEKLPMEGPLIIAPNHSGNAFPHDAMIMDALLWRNQGFSKTAKCRSVYSPKLAAVWWMRPFAIDNWWRRCGGVDMTFANYDKLLSLKKKVIYYPEGVPGIGKGFTRRYQLQHYYSSFVVLAARHGAPVYPVSVVNAEWVNPGSITFKMLDRVVDKLFGIPFVPLPIFFLALLFPFLFYFAFPCQMVFRIGDPIDVRQLLREAQVVDEQNPTRAEAQAVAERIRQYAQKQLNQAVETYGKKPYNWPTFRENMRAIRGRRFRTSPLGWPFTFIQHDRNLKRPPARNRLHRLLRDFDIWFYYVPLGWIFIALARRWRKPPCGYRSLSKTERREREGSYRWRLSKRPLPHKAE